MSDTMTLSAAVGIGERFARSVNLEMDFAEARSLEGYVLTPVAKSLLQRMARGMAQDSTQRAWSVTGPYGAGKSAALLLATRALGYPVDTGTREFISQEDPELWGSIVKALPSLNGGGFAILPAVGSRQSIEHTLLQSVDRLLEQLRPFPDIAADRLEAISAQVHEMLSQQAANSVASPGMVVEIIVELANALSESFSQITGVLIVYDELGKALEHMASRQDASDVGILQMLAETASRSTEPAIGIVTVLHQAFEHYARSLAMTQRNEWAKVQGRFEDVGFLESSGEVLNLIARAIEHGTLFESLNGGYAQAAERAIELDLVPRDLLLSDATELVRRCAPLHPTVVLILGRLFRSRLAQNERSLFAFLSSGEHESFRTFLSQAPISGDCAFYRLDRLYDYVVSALGSGLYASGDGKKWAEIEDALDRLPPDAPAIDARLIKAIGLLDLVGDQSCLKASREAIEFAFVDETRTTSDVIENALNRLVESSLIVYRHFKSAFSLWQGSDVNLDERYETALAQLDRTVSLADLLRQQNAVVPMVAKRHLHETGTLRYFSPIVLDEYEFTGMAKRDDLEEYVAEHVLSKGADGAIVYVLGDAHDSWSELVSRARQVSGTLDSAIRHLVFFAIPKRSQGLREALDEVIAWRWVAKNTPRLAGDRIARRELTARRSQAEERLESLCEELLGVSQGYAHCDWVVAGKARPFGSARALREALSQGCDLGYDRSPRIKNELINRRKLSSAAAGARRSLIEAMLEHQSEKDLGLQGYPPERSMYLSVLDRAGIHREGPEGWRFVPPPADDPCHLQPAWDAMDEFLAGTEQMRGQVTALYDILGSPPYGIKEGLLPVLLTAKILSEQTRVGVYEEGAFVPQVTTAVLERLIRVPERFELRRYEITGARKSLLAAYAGLFGESPGEDDPGILEAVTPLLAFAKSLPRYAQLTNDLSDSARRLRGVLLSAREPRPLLFDRLPEALAFSILPKDDALVEEYLGQLKRTIAELHTAYPKLLDRIEEELFEELLLPTDHASARQAIRKRAQNLSHLMPSMDLAAFAQRLSDQTLDRTKWIESTAALLASKPPRNWSDRDIATFRTNLAQLAGQFRRTEDAASTADKMTGGSNLVRLAITRPDGREQREAVSVLPGETGQIRTLASDILAAVGSGRADRRIRLLALGEALQRLLMADEDNSRDHGKDRGASGKTRHSDQRRKGASE